jgi:hypothetical protein
LLITDLTRMLPRTSPWPTRTAPIDCIVIHHSVTPSDYPLDRIAEYHIGRGYPGIAYHYAIPGDGAIYRTNSDNLLTWHGHDGNSGIGVCLLGDFTSTPPTEAQLRAAAWLVAYLRGLYGPLPVLGHRECGRAATACPGDTWPQWRHRLETPPTGEDMTRTKLGSHYQQPSAEAFAWHQAALPPAIKAMGNVGPHDVSDLFPAYDAAGLARPFLLAREWTDDKRDEWVRQGAAGARAFFERVIRRYSQWRHLTDVGEGINEFVPWTPDDMRRLNEFDAEAARLFHREGFRYVGGNFSVGWPELADWPLYLDALREMDFLGLHEYHWPGLPEDGYRTLRYRRAIAAIREAGGRVPPILITEVGWDKALLGGGHEGFIKSGDQRAYLEWLKRYDSELQQDAEVLYAYIFETGAASDWHAMGFDVVGSEIAEDIAAYMRSAAVPNPAPVPDKGETLDIQAFDWQGNPTTVEALQAKYKFQIRRATQEPGKEVFRLSAIREKAGDTAVIARCRLADGAPDVSRHVAGYWPDAPARDVPGQWYDRYEIGQTNASGEVTAITMGSGGVIRDDGGPHAVWVVSPSTPSDCLDRIGWLGGTDHLHVNPEFTLVREPAPTPQPTPDPTPKPSAITAEDMQRAREGLGIVPATIKAAVERGYVWLKEIYTPGDEYALALVWDGTGYRVLKLDARQWQVVGEAAL